MADWRAAARALPPVKALETRVWQTQRKRLLEATLDDAAALRRFGDRSALPDGYGSAYDERVVEIPWVFAQRPAGRVLDAGSALNHAFAVRRLVPSVDALDIVTLAPERNSFAQLGVSYLYADLRELPLRSGLYDTVVSVSTLEHVGMDNTHYGAGEGATADAAAAARAAVAELRRVLKPGGRLLLTVPFGRAESHGWLRQFDRAALDDLVAAAQPARVDVGVWRNGARGWQPVDAGDAADARYGAHKAEAVAAVAVTMQP
jgi:SAM-dependent methyltransferase